jgi:glucose/arabinose dehydrogenase
MRTFTRLLVSGFALTSLLFMNPAVSEAQPKVIAEGLEGPTQFVVSPDGKFVLVAQLNGDEEAKTGQVLRIDLPSKKKTVLWDRLDKPTGLALTMTTKGAMSVWVMQKRSLWTAPYAPSLKSQDKLFKVLSDLPFNGRSEGTLTPTPDGHLLYETTGNIDGAGKVVKGSGTLWSFNPIKLSSTVVATGLKNSYAHVILPDGRALITEIGDNVTNAPVEELNIVSLDPKVTKIQNAGWPTCPGEKTCKGVTTPIATFAPKSTPTGVAIDTTYAYVSLFVPGEIYRVPLKSAATSAKNEPELIVNQLQGPHTIVRRPDGALWITEHFSGRIVSVKP